MSDYTVTELRSTGSFAPARWEGEIEDGTPIHFRYRWGQLTVRLNDQVNGEIVFQEQLNEDESDSHLTQSELIENLESEGFEFDYL